MTIEEIRKGAPNQWGIGKYAVIVFYISVLFFFLFGCVIGYIFHPVISVL